MLDFGTHFKLFFKRAQSQSEQFGPGSQYVQNKGIDKQKSWHIMA